MGSFCANDTPQTVYCDPTPCLNKQTIKRMIKVEHFCLLLDGEKLFKWYVRNMDFISGYKKAAKYPNYILFHYVVWQQGTG